MLLLPQARGQSSVRGKSSLSAAAAAAAALTALVESLYYYVWCQPTKEEASAAGTFSRAGSLTTTMVVGKIAHIHSTYSLQD
jgi:hypothetical protein